MRTAVEFDQSTPEMELKGGGRKSFFPKCNLSAELSAAGNQQGSELGKLQGVMVQSRQALSSQGLIWCCREGWGLALGGGSSRSALQGAANLQLGWPPSPIPLPRDWVAPVLAKVRR